MNIKQIFRDKTRDKLQKKLLDIGINCDLAERGIVEEKLFKIDPGRTTLKAPTKTAFPIKTFLL